ncbi:MAG TPA: hypothetical protein VF329_09230 [Gammaproteobacteria bacterium]
MRPRFKIELLLVALLCFGPVVAAYVLYYYGAPRALPRLANEERLLLDPVVPLPPLAGREASGEAVENLWARPLWSLIYARTSPCDERCGADLVRLRQVHAALGRDQSRVRLVYVGPGADPGAAKAVAVGSFDAGGGARLLELLQDIGQPPGERGRIYVADPHGNLVLSYPPDARQKGLYDDLERLLDVSRIG